MTACRKYRKQFSAYMDGELPSKKQVTLSDHLADMRRLPQGVGGFRGAWPCLEPPEGCPAADPFGITHRGDSPTATG